MNDQLILDVGRGPPDKVVPLRKFTGAGFTNAPQRHAEDFYPTRNWEAPEALLRAERIFLSKFTDIWEPACGEGHIADIIKGHGFRVHATDLVDRGYGTGGVDFLKTAKLSAPAIITNPPFKDLPLAFVRHAFSLGARYVALLLPAEFWCSNRSASLYRELMPRRIYPLAFRVDFTGGGKPTQRLIWCVWEFGTPTTFCEMCPPLQKPKGSVGQKGLAL